MSDRKTSNQATLNIFGFVFIGLGLGLESSLSFVLLGLAIACFVAALVIAAVSSNDDSPDNH